MNRFSRWRPDPFGIHQQRYFAHGEPTAVVRDDGRESLDRPPGDRLPVNDPATAVPTGVIVGEHYDGSATIDSAPPPTVPASTPLRVDCPRGSGTHSEDVPLANGPQVPAPGNRVDGVGYWVCEMDKAVTRAHAANEPDAWREARQAAVVVTDIARAMQLTAKAREAAQLMAKTAQDALAAAQAASQRATDSGALAEQRAQDSQGAARAARDAHWRAVASQRAAEELARAISGATEASIAATNSSDEADHKARLLEEIVANAEMLDTPAAWTNALQSLAATGRPAHHSAAT